MSCKSHFLEQELLNVCFLTDSEHCHHNHHNHGYNHAHCGPGDGGPGAHDRWAEPCRPQVLAGQAPSLSIVPRVSQANPPNYNKEPFCSSSSFTAPQAKLMCPKDFFLNRIRNKEHQSSSYFILSNLSNQACHLAVFSLSQEICWTITSRCWARPCCDIQSLMVMS